MASSSQYSEQKKEKQREKNSGTSSYSSKPMEVGFMPDGIEINSEAIDRSILAKLRELQDEGEPDIVIELSDLFFTHAPVKIEAIKEALKGGDAKALHVAAHGLKSSSSYLGATRLSSLSKKLEEIGRTEHAGRWCVEWKCT